MSKKMTNEEFIEAYNDLEKFPSVISLKNYLQLRTTRSIRKRVENLRKKGHYLIDRRNKGKNGGKTLSDKSEEYKNVEILRLRQQISNMQGDIKELEKKALQGEEVKNLIHGESNYIYKSNPKWLLKSKNKNVIGIPTLLVSDVHFDEVVDPAQVNYVNKYNREIACRRVKNTFEHAIDYLFNRIANPKYDGIVVPLLGDLLSGLIHDELVETNEDTVLASILSLTELLIECFDFTLKYFDNIFVPCVVGNHSRISKKPRNKNRVKDNLEWLVYHFLAKHYKDNKKIQFAISESSDIVVGIYDKKFLFTHGDQFKGGQAIAGIFSPLMRGALKKHQRQSSINKPFDVLVIGHFHQYIHTESFVVNGASKGYDEFAWHCNFPFQPPQQALWINHPEKGMIFRTPIYCDKQKEKYKGKDKITIL